MSGLIGLSALADDARAAIGSGSSGASLLDRGNWGTSTAYAVGDVATQGGQRYACRVAHTAGTFATDLAASKWVALDAVAAATDTAVVHLTGAETVAGVKTFSSAPVVPPGAFPEAAVANLTTDLAAKATATRLVSAGTGLTGGGDLTADRTLTVTYGTTAGTAAQGNDTRITGALQAANNLSDLANAATARTSLGTHQGVYASGNYYPATGVQGVGSSSSWVNGQLRVAPWMVPDAITLTRIASEVSGTGDAGCKVRLGIYADSGGMPGALVLDAGTIAGDALAVAEITISQALARGLYWVGGVIQLVTTTVPTLKTTGELPRIPISFGTCPPRTRHSTPTWSPA